MVVRLFAMSGVLVALLGAVFIVSSHAETAAKTEIRLNLQLSKNGSMIGDPVLRMVDGGTGSITLRDGTTVKITAATAAH